jgi:tetratricopeptide (TPR) repeat protein
MAINDYATAIDLDPTGAQALRWPCIGSVSRGIVFSARAELYVSLGDERKAIDDYSSLISLDPENMQAYLSRAKAYDKINDDYAAVRDRSEAIKLVPGNPLLYEMRAYSYDKLHQYEKGVDDCSTAIGIMSTETFQADKPFGDPRHGLAQAYYQRGGIPIQNGQTQRSNGGLLTSDQSLPRAFKADRVPDQGSESMTRSGRCKSQRISIHLSRFQLWKILLTEPALFNWCRVL